MLKKMHPTQQRIAAVVILVVAFTALYAALKMSDQPTTPVNAAPDSTSKPRRNDGRATIAERLGECGQDARERLRPFFSQAGVSYPPARLCIVAIKQDKLLHICAAGPDGAMRFIRSYPILGVSGQLGPKLREGDRQVPEGIYAIDSLNPNSKYHLSLRVNYPNAFDRAMARQDGRSHSHAG